MDEMSALTVTTRHAESVPFAIVRDVDINIGSFQDDFHQFEEDFRMLIPAEEQ